MLITVYTSYTSKTISNVRKFMEENDLDYYVIKLFPGLLGEKEIKSFLNLLDGGIEEIVTAPSYEKYKIDKMRLQEAIRFMADNPHILKNPIIVGDGKIQVGYNSGTIRKFIPRKKRN